MKRIAICLTLVTTAFCAVAATGAVLQVAVALSPPSTTIGGVYSLGTGGPDAFGYRWDDTVPYAWIDA